MATNRIPSTFSGDIVVAMLPAAATRPEAA